jgi:hypothetical protein
MVLQHVGQASELLDHAGKERSENVILAEYKTVLLNGHNFEQVELDQFAGLLRQAPDLWCHFNNDSRSAPTALPHPSIRLARSLALPPPPKTTTPQPPLAFVIIVQGLEGAHINKVRISYSREKAAAACMEEALNGFSVVFSGAVLEGFKKFGATWPFVVRSSMEGPSVGSDYARQLMPVWC